MGQGQHPGRYLRKYLCLVFTDLYRPLRHILCFYFLYAFDNKSNNSFCLSDYGILTDLLDTRWSSSRIVFVVSHESACYSFDFSSGEICTCVYVNSGLLFQDGVPECTALARVEIKGTRERAARTEARVKEDREERRYARTYLSRACIVRSADRACR